MSEGNTARITRMVGELSDCDHVINLNQKIELLKALALVEVMNRLDVISSELYNVTGAITRHQ